MPTHHIGELAALGTACCWTVTALSFESAGRKVGSLPVNFIRLAVAILFLSIFGWLTRGRALPLDASPHAVLWLSASGLVGFAIGDLCLFRAFVEIGSRLSTLLMSLVPPMTALAGLVILGEKLVLVDWLGMTLTIGGVVWVVLERVPDRNGRTARVPTRGILLALGGALGQAIGLVMSKYGMGDYNAFAATQIRVMAGAAGFAVLFAFVGRWPHVAGALRNGPAMGLTGLGAFFGPFLGVSLSLVAVQNTRAGLAATLMALLPVLMLPAAFFVRKERITGRAIGGAVLAFAGAALLFR